ncbi:type II toxin-antitoxin system HicB family antitoxin [Pseudanabaena sp. 'Roaring Creek']|uniref:type II toxin-antitoxin system HicB family antitoxin n=1 Tax=Pseudanabaena sp. 'Roaring Creek' TaxID=1681830 RepID=UPI0006D77D5B|nr:type II toxin-antitoxin system HicB family antitoxin [Pseudanabaena sp. 'Roaring Creek']
MAVATYPDLLKRTVLLYRDEDGYFIVEVPSLVGCVSQGETREEALANIQEAIALHIEVLQDRGEPKLS